MKILRGKTSSPKNKIFIRILNILILQIGLIGDIVVEIKSQQLQISLVYLLKYGE